MLDEDSLIYAYRITALRKLINIFPAVVFKNTPMFLELTHIRSKAILELALKQKCRRRRIDDYIVVISYDPIFPQ